MDDCSVEALPDWQEMACATVGADEDVSPDFIEVDAEVVFFDGDDEEGELALEPEPEPEAPTPVERPKIHVVKGPDGKVLREFADPADAYLYAKSLRGPCTVHKKVRAFHVRDLANHYFGDADDRADAERQLALLGRPGSIVETTEGMTLLLQTFKRV